MVWLTKSRYLLGLQCPKLLWISVHDKARLPPVDEETQALFDRGHEIGENAKDLFPEGVDVPDDDFKVNIHLTQQLLKQHKTLFEAGFLVDDLYSRADVIVPVDDLWDIIEVKSSRSVKKVHIEDLAFQKFVYEKNGLKIRKCFVMFFKDEKFVKEDVTDRVEEKMKGISERVERMQRILEMDDYPEVKKGDHCSSPYGCVLEGEGC